MNGLGDSIEHNVLLHQSPDQVLALSKEEKLDGVGNTTTGVQRGGGCGECGGPGHTAWGHATTEVSLKSVGKCLKTREKKAKARGIPDREASHRKKLIRFFK